MIRAFIAHPSLRRYSASAMRPDELAAHEAIRGLIAAYAHAVDSGRFDDAAACFADDGVLDVADGSRSVGSTAIAERFAAAGRKLAAATDDGVPFVRHHVSSILIDDVDVSAGLAAARSYFLVVTEVGLDHRGRYRDTFRRVAGVGWRFTERNVVVDGRSGPSRMR